jgi:hypothetical protein
LAKTITEKISLNKKGERADTFDYQRVAEYVVVLKAQPKSWQRRSTNWCNNRK